MAVCQGLGFCSVRAGSCAPRCVGERMGRREGFKADIAQPGRGDGGLFWRREAGEVLRRGGAGACWVGENKGIEKVLSLVSER